jgi:membrane associated rhomboid family serine protease
MSDTPTGAGTSVLDESEETYCYGHPKTPTRLRCSRCDKPICGRCAVPAAVGQHCVWCVAEARKSAPKVRSALQANSPIVLAIIVIDVIIWVLQNLTLNNPTPTNVTARFFSSPELIASGEWWRLITPMFLHAPLRANFGLFHLLFNMYVLRIYGPNVEEAFGKIRFIGMYLIAGFIGNVASYAFGGCNGGYGASGAIFGMVGVLLVYLYRRRTSVVLAQYMKNLWLFVGINLVFGFAVAGIDNLAHIGGLLGGAALGAGFDQGPASRMNVGLQVVTAVVITGIGVGLAMWRTANFSC